MAYCEPVKSDFVSLDDLIDSEFHSHKKRITRPILTKYEKARILGLRATQISKGAVPTIDIAGMKDALKIAKCEFDQGDIPLIIRRHLPDGSYEDWLLKELSH